MTASSPASFLHDRSSTLAKTLLLSFWLGIDALALLLMSMAPVLELLRHSFLLLGVLAVLISGTTFAALFVWANSTPIAILPWPPGLRQWLASVRDEPRRLLALGGALSCLLIALSAAGIALLHQRHHAALLLGRADLALASKCAEVARLENELFRAQQQFVMAQCLIQYDRNYESLRQMLDRQ